MEQVQIQQLGVRVREIASDVIDEIWTIYHHPTDYPEGFVLTKHTVTIDRAIVPNFRRQRAAILEDLRKLLPAGVVMVHWPGQSPGGYESYMWPEGGGKCVH